MLGLSEGLSEILLELGDVLGLGGKLGRIDSPEGCELGFLLGLPLGFLLGVLLGIRLGFLLGLLLGFPLGCLLGLPLGLPLGFVLGFGLMEGLLLGEDDEVGILSETSLHGIPAAFKEEHVSAFASGLSASVIKPLLTAWSSDGLCLPV